MACNISSVVVAKLHQMGALDTVDSLVNTVNATGQNAVGQLDEGSSGGVTQSICYHLLQQDNPAPAPLVIQGTGL